jgi:hypothetical protein
MDSFFVDILTREAKESNLHYQHCFAAFCILMKLSLHAKANTLSVDVYLCHETRCFGHLVYQNDLRLIPLSPVIIYDYVACTSNAELDINVQCTNGMNIPISRGAATSPGIDMASHIVNARIGFIMHGMNVSEYDRQECMHEYVGRLRLSVKQRCGELKRRSLKAFRHV